MSTVVILLRIASLLVFAVPMLVAARGRRADSGTRTSKVGGAPAPLIANLAAFASFLPSLVIYSRSPDASEALPLALSGCLLAVAGMALVLRSRTELGAAWSLSARADQDAGIVTTGPYSLVRHPIYLGLTLLALGEALAFGSLVAALVVLFAIVPTFAWRARTEEKLLRCTFGERYDVYRRRTRMIIPYIL